jgi:branched-chain amino acid transport system substrate-binding protein
MRSYTYLNRHRMAASLMALVAVAGLTACSSSGNKTAGAAGTSAAPSVADSPPTQSVGSSAASGSVSGSPIKVGVLYTDDNPLGTSPEIKYAALAAQSYINAHGGYGGHPVQVVSCNGKNNPTNDAQCAQQFISSKVITVIGLDGVWGSVGVPIINKAGILNQTNPISGPEYSSPNAFPFNGELIAAGNAIADWAAQNNIKTLTCIYSDVASLEQSCKEYVGKPAAAKGIKVTQIAVPVTATDVGQYAQKLEQTKSQVVAPIAGAPVTEALISDAKQDGYTPTWFVPGSNAQSSFFKALGSSANGINYYMDYKAPADTGDAETQIFLNAMKQYQPSSQVDAAASIAFSNLMTLQTIANKIGAANMTSSGLKQAIQSANNLAQFMGAPLTAGKNLPGLPNCLGVTQYLYTWANNKYTPLGAGLYSF